MAKLRSKPDGCPWDLEQTTQSLRRYLLEETYELLESIDREDHQSQQEELGDLLLQVIFQCQIASEKKHFTFSEVVDGICRKIIRRHPHIFGDQTAKTPDEVIYTWEKIKKAEKNTTDTGILASVLTTLPALVEAYKLSEKAARYGFDWENPFQVMHKLKEELLELDEALEQPPGKPSTQQIAWELGDLIFAAVNLARHYNLFAEDLLREANQRFRSRFEIVEKLAAERDIHIGKANIETLEELWQEAKSRTRKSR